MGAFLTIVVIALLLAAAALHLTGHPRLAAWLLVIFPGFLCLAYLHDLAKGSRILGLAAFQGDEKQLVVACFMLAVSIFAAFRTQWRWLFWTEWFLNGIACGMLVYLVFFWHVFS
jgi:hypothetical protein